MSRAVFTRTKSARIDFKKTEGTKNWLDIPYNIIKKQKLDQRIIKLSEEINKYFHYLHNYGPKNSKVELLNQEITSKLSENNHEIIQYILNKAKRTKEELNIIKAFLSTMKYLSSMISIRDEEKTFFSLSVYLKMEKKNKDSIVFRYGHKGNKFYIILSGQISILIIKETKVSITFLRFIQHLLLLKMMKEDELFKKTIIANNRNQYHVDENTFDFVFQKIEKYEENYNKNKKMETQKDEDSIDESENVSGQEGKGNLDKEELIARKKTSLHLNNFCNDFIERVNDKKEKSIEKEVKSNVIKNPEKKDNKKIYYNPQSQSNLQEPIKLFSLNTRNISNLCTPFFSQEKESKEILSFYIYLKENFHNFKKKKISVNDYIRDTYIDSKYYNNFKEEPFSKKDEFIIYSYYEIVQKNKGDTFGELALQHNNNKRTATVITNKDCIFGYLIKKNYQTCLSEIELKRRKNEVNFILSFSIFDKMNWHTFEIKYFNFFKREHFTQGQAIITEGKSFNKIFFIMEGQFDITSNLSIAGLYKIIRQKSNYSFPKKNVDLKNKIHNIRLCICNNKDILGLSDCCFYGAKGEHISFINAICKSNKSIVFTLDKTIFSELKEKIDEFRDNITIIINNKEKVMLDRLKSIFNQLINDIDKIKGNKNKKYFIVNNKKINNLLIGNVDKKVNSPYKNSILSGKYKKIFIQSYESNKSKYNSSLDNLNKNINKSTQDGRLLSSTKYRINGNITFESTNDNRKENDLFSYEYKKKIKKIIAEKENKYIKQNPIRFLKSAVSLKELNEKKNIKKKMENLYLPINKMIYKEYKKLFNSLDYKVKKAENQSKIIYEGRKNENNKLINKSEIKDSLIITSLINKEKNWRKEENIKLEKNKNNRSMQNIKNNINRITLKNLQKKETQKSKNYLYHSTEKLSNNYNNNKKFIKNYSNSNIHNEAIRINMNNNRYLKKILGTSYKNEEDAFISRAERKIMKEIYDYKTDLKKRKEAKIRFSKKNKSEKKIYFNVNQNNHKNKSFNNRYKTNS